ncbi:MAG: alpha-hydroxy acid oxidase [Oceanospirillaceae bacterium]
MNINKRFPCIDDLEAEAARRIPGFAHEYLIGGLGREICVQRNLDDLAQMQLMPSFHGEISGPSIECEFLGKKYSAPFGVAPLGLAGLLWPGSETILAKAAKSHNIPYVLSTYATISMQASRALSDDMGWFQFYPPNDQDLEQDIIQRAIKAGYDTLMVTVDTPTATKRERDLRNGISVPLSFDHRTLGQIVSHPRWLLAMLKQGMPEFEVLKPYFPVSNDVTAAGMFITDKMQGRITVARLQRIRRLWPGKIMVKGILCEQDAKAYLKAGADGLVISNHGGRQFDAAPSAGAVLPRIRKEVGKAVPIIADGGIRSGLDIAKMLSLGADFVLLGRPFIYACAALGDKGGEHIMNILKDELRSAVSQMGCSDLEGVQKE